VEVKDGKQYLSLSSCGSRRWEATPFYIIMWKEYMGSNMFLYHHVEVEDGKPHLSLSSCGNRRGEAIPFSIIMWKYKREVLPFSIIMWK